MCTETMNMTGEEEKDDEGTGFCEIKILGRETEIVTKREKKVGSVY